MVAQQFTHPLKYPSSGIEALVSALTKDRREFEVFLNSAVVRKESDGTVDLPASSTVNAVPIVDSHATGLTFLRLPVKASTGHPASPSEGDTYANSADNGIFSYLDGAWQTIATW